MEGMRLASHFANKTGSHHHRTGSFFRTAVLLTMMAVIPVSSNMPKEFTGYKPKIGQVASDTHKAGGKLKPLNRENAVQETAQQEIKAETTDANKAKMEAKDADKKAPTISEFALEAVKVAASILWACIMVPVAIIIMVVGSILQMALIAIGMAYDLVASFFNALGK